MSAKKILEIIIAYKFPRFRIVFPVPDSMRGKPLDENRKAAALAKHVTALKPDAVDFLYAFVKEEEIFWEIEEMRESDERK